MVGGEYFSNDFIRFSRVIVLSSIALAKSARTSFTGDSCVSMSVTTDLRRGSAVAFIMSSPGEVFAFLSLCFFMDAGVVLTFV